MVPESGLNLRDAPSRKAKSVWLLPRGTMVTHKQLPENEKIDTIEDQKENGLKSKLEMNPAGYSMFTSRNLSLVRMEISFILLQLKI